MRLQPLFVEIGHHRVQYVLASVQLGLFFVPAHGEAHRILPKRYGRLEPRHFVAGQLFGLARLRLDLELRLRDLGEQGYFVGATRREIPILQQVLVVAQIVHGLLSEML